ncbi:hypothetical protein [Nocardia brasiliensis]|uniref:hypothetical protein n=1 Tax=Nocardia brasiliensis TaxID=37326 RepID=UPI002457E00B|nr:hypothetical protein [Nocardia brasiliensis]
MEPLDEKTLSSLADLICGDDTLHYRRAVDLVDFFRSAGWDEITDYDGESRRSWTHQQLGRKRHDTDAMERVLCRLVDRREYPGRPELTDAIHADLNRLLEPELVHIELDSDLRPHVRPGRAQPDRPPEDPSRRELLYRVEDVVTDRRLIPLLNQRIREFHACRETGSYLAAVILAGSLLEGILHDAAQHRPVPPEVFDEPEAKKLNVSKPRGPGDWGLHSLAFVARRLQWIDSDVGEVIGALRKFRNIVHPRQQLELIGEVPDADTLEMYWPIVVGTINDLARTKPSNSATNRDGISNRV